MHHLRRSGVVAAGAERLHATRPLGRWRAWCNEAVRCNRSSLHHDTREKGGRHSTPAACCAAFAHLLACAQLAGMCKRCPRHGHGCVGCVRPHAGVRIQAVLLASCRACMTPPSTACMHACMQYLQTHALVYALTMHVRIHAHTRVHTMLCACSLQMLAAYNSGVARNQFQYPSGVENFKRHFAHLEAGGGWRSHGLRPCVLWATACCWVGAAL